MSSSVYTLVLAQFLSAFADNAVLFTVIAMVLQAGSPPSWYVPALQSVFLVAFVVLTPWVGALANRYPKPWILVFANFVKALGAVSILTGLEPLIGYSIIGAGAAAYSPAKYGVLPELTDTAHLVKANSWIEGATLAAILLGTVVGARIADSSIKLALLAVVGTFLLSAATALRLPRLTAQISLANGATQVAAPMRALWADRRTRLILWALSLFWACAATLRVVLVAWAPEVLSTKTASQIAELTLFLALGIIAGSAVVPRLIPLERIRRTRFAGYALGGFFLVLAGVDQLWSARAVLLLIGVAGGIFVVPLNAAIQQAGHRSVGSGGAVAVQNFFQNSAMLLSIGLYAAAAASGLGPVPAIAMLGIAVTLFTATMSARL